MTNEQNEREHEDPMAPSRGILFALILSAAFYALCWLSWRLLGPTVLEWLR